MTEWKLKDTQIENVNSFFMLRLCIVKLTVSSKRAHEALKICINSICHGSPLSIKLH